MTIPHPFVLEKHPFIRLRVLHARPLCVGGSDSKPGDKRYDSLRDSVAAGGFKVPVLFAVDDTGSAMIVDGHHRVEVAIELGMLVPVDVWRGVVEWRVPGVDQLAESFGKTNYVTGIEWLVTPTEDHGT